MATVDTLYRLQTIDAALARVRERLQEIDRQLAGNRELQVLRRSVNSLLAQVSSSRGRLRDLELESDGIKEKIAVTQNRLYGGQVTNPRELTSLQDEIGYLERRQRRMEDELLEAMIRLDDEAHELETQQDRLNRTMVQWEATQAELGSERAELEAEAEDLAAQRHAVQASVQAQDLSLYEDLRRQKKGMAVVRVEGPVCGGCGMLLPSSVIQQLRQSEVLHLCPNCGRILCHQ